jgi:hypothetical protein
MKNGLLHGAAATAVMLVTVAGCKSVGVVGYPAEFVDSHAPEHVWISKADKSVTELYGPQLHGDTLVGFVKGTGQYMEVPIADIQLMKAPMFSPMKTALFVGTAAIGSALALTAVMGNGGSGGANVCFPPGGLNQGLPVPCPKP